MDILVRMTADVALFSYYFAETLNYFYLTFSDTSLVSLDDFT